MTPKAEGITPKADGITPRCHRPWQEMIIDSDGSVAPCCYWSAYGNRNPAMGNVNENSVQDIWNGKPYQKLRKAMAAGDLKAAGCADCFAIKQKLSLQLLCDDQGRDTETDYGRNVRTLQDEVAKGATVLKAKPTLIAIAPSHHCHLKCSHCSQEPTRHLALDRDSALDEVISLTNVLVRLNAVGGEPFILPEWRDFLKTFDPATNPYLCFSTCTSGTILPKDVLDGLKRFKSVNINISVDGTGPVYERVRIGAIWDDLQKNIAALKDIVGENEESAIGVSMSVMRSNIHDLPNFIRWAADERLLFGIIPVTTPLTESLISYADGENDVAGWRAALDEAKQLAQDYWLSRYMGNLPYGQDEHDTWQQAVANIDEMIDWTTFDRPHFRVKIALPPEALGDGASGDGDGRTGVGAAKMVPPKMVPPKIVHFVEAGSTLPIPRYHAPVVPAYTDDTVDGGGYSVRVALPAGRFEAFVGDKWSSDGANWFTVLVPDGARPGSELAGEWSGGNWESFWKLSRFLKRGKRALTLQPASAAGAGRG